jgi:hypothetical protein
MEQTMTFRLLSCRRTGLSFSFTFKQPGEYFYNDCTSPRATGEDSRLLRVGGLREDANLEFRTEFFNVWNHAQYANPGTGAQTTSYGVINASSVAPRLIQFALEVHLLKTG